MLGEQIGNFEIVSLLGRGGMGNVYLAKHCLLDRTVAIKVLLPQFGGREEVVKRFFNEARAATAIKTPSIVEIYDFGYHEGAAYIVMEYLDGETLGQRMRRLGRLDEKQAVAMARKIALALAAAHGAGIIHRDLKPDNVFIVPDPAVAGRERVKLLDFGIAKLLGDDTCHAVTTRAGMIIGTPAYMSPEQCEGAGRPDPRSDLYALGCILFHMLCGQPPFVARSSSEIMALHLLGRLPRISGLVPDLSRDIEAILARLLARDPADRYDNAEQLIVELDALSGFGTRFASGSGAHQLPRRRRSTDTDAGSSRRSSTQAKTPEQPSRTSLAGFFSRIFGAGAMSTSH